MFARSGALGRGLAAYISRVKLVATPTGVTVKFCHATRAGVTRPDLRKIIFFHSNSDEDNYYMKIVVLNEIYNFVVLSFFI